MVQNTTWLSYPNGKISTQVTETIFVGNPSILVKENTSIHKDYIIETGLIYTFLYHLDGFSVEQQGFH